jgi:hypothetical protein
MFFVMGIHDEAGGHFTMFSATGDHSYHSKNIS